MRKPTIAELEVMMDKQLFEIMPNGDVKLKECEKCKTIRVAVLEEAIIEARKKRLCLLSNDDLTHMDRDLKVREQMRREIVEALMSLQAKSK